MTFTKRECLAICFCLVPKQMDTLEKARARRTLFSAMNLSGLAQDVGDIMRAPQASVSGEWLDRTVDVQCELTAEQRAFLLDMLKPPWFGGDSEVLLGVREKLETP